MSASSQAYLYWKTGSRTIVAFKNMYCRLGRKVTVSSSGRLLLGNQWPWGRYFPSQFVARDAAQIEVTGAFSIMTACNVWIESGAVLSLGSGYINNGLLLSCHEPITIGQEVAIAHNVTIRDTDSHSSESGRPTSAPVRIGNHVWIGLNANDPQRRDNRRRRHRQPAVVTRDVPASCLVAGVPACVRRRMSVGPSAEIA